MVVWGFTCHDGHAYGGQRSTYGNCYAPSTIRVLGAKFNSSDSATNIKPSLGYPFLSSINLQKVEKTGKRSYLLFTQIPPIPTSQIQYKN